MREVNKNISLLMGREYTWHHAISRMWGPATQPTLSSRAWWLRQLPLPPPGPGRRSPGPDCGMAVRLLCYVALYLLGAGKSQTQNSLKSKRNIFLCARFASGFSVKAHLGLCDQFLSFSLRLHGCWCSPDPKTLCDRDGKEDYSRMFSNNGP